MDPITIGLLASLGVSAAGAAGNAYLGGKQANAAERQAELDREEERRRFDLQMGMQQQNQPYEQAGALAQLRQALSQPTQYDFLSALNTRYTGAPAGG